MNYLDSYYKTFILNAIANVFATVNIRIRKIEWACGKKDFPFVPFVAGRRRQISKALNMDS